MQYCGASCSIGSKRRRKSSIKGGEDTREIGEIGDREKIPRERECARDRAGR